MFYTGVGSRDLPEDIYDLITCISANLASMGYTVRTGGADGADTAFIAGAHGIMENYIPWQGFGEYGGIVPDLDLNWNFLQGISNINPLIHNPNTRNMDKYKGFWKLHARNVSQVLGLTLKTPSKFCILYAPTTSTGVTGGTNTAYQVAVQSGIPCFNLYEKEARERLMRFCERQ